MSKGKKTGGRDIKPGQVLNPKGNPVMPPIVKAIRISSKETVARIYWDVVNMTEAQIGVRLKDPNLPLLERNVLAAVLKDIAKGTITTVEKLMERTLGKPKEVIQLDGVINQGNAVDLSKLSNDEVISLMTLLKRGQVPVGDKSDS